MTTILISGLGLIGSSLARMIRQSTPTARLWGTDPDEENSRFMLDNQLIDERVNFEIGAAQADIIVLAGPVSVITDQLRTLTTLTLKPDVFVTDVGSTKMAIMQAAEPLMAQGVAFAGGHPMAGSHQTGSAAGKIALFRQASYFLIPGNASEQQIKDFKALLAPAEFKWVTVDATQHDQLVSTTSHLPHVVSATLMNVASEQLEGEPAWRAGVAGGFRDTTRIAAADPAMWTAILADNKTAILNDIDVFSQALAELKVALEADDQAKIYDFFATAKRTRETLDQS